MTIKEAINTLPVTALPHNAAKDVTYKNSVGIQNPNGMIPNKLYKNFQLTDYFLANDEETVPAMYAKFNIPNQNYILAAVSFGGVTDYMTDVLIVVDNSGNIISTLEANIWYFPGIAAKQYRILSDGSVIISVLKPTTSTSVLFNDFSSFTANRIDYTYKITNGKFVLSDTKTYPVTTYTKSQLSNKSYNLWN